MNCKILIAAAALLATQSFAIIGIGAHYNPGFGTTLKAGEKGPVSDGISFSHEGADGMMQGFGFKLWVDLLPIIDIEGTFNVRFGSYDASLYVKNPVDQSETEIPLEIELGGTPFGMANPKFVTMNGDISITYPLVIVYSYHSATSLVRKMSARDDRFIICEAVNIDQGYDYIKERIMAYDGAIICDIPGSLRNDILKYCYDNGKRTYVTPKVSDIIIRSGENLHVFDTPLLLCRNTGLTFEQKVLKRIVDILLSLIALVLTSPFMLITAIAIKAYDKGPVFYKQARVTKDGKVFDIIKFRSMIPNAEADGKSRPAVSDDERITPIGKVIRAIRFDEMPQIFNILKGDMSIVGPRPERVEHVEKYTKEMPEFAYRLKVKAGLTGYAQVYGKYNTTSYDKLKLDLFYIENYSLRTDIRLIFMTIKVLFMKESTEGFDKADDNSASGAPQS